MKLQKPVYDSARKVYVCEVTDGIRFECKREDGEWTHPFTQIPSDIVSTLATQLVDTMKHWFSKPITYEWLFPRLQMTIQEPSVGDDFEGTVVWSVSTITISKETFSLEWKIVDSRPAPKVTIAFEEEEEIEEVKSIPGTTLEDSLELGPTRRVLHKHKVMQARARAARALFKAERATQEYIQLYGEDTDWEDEDSGEESS